MYVRSPFFCLLANEKSIFPPQAHILTDLMAYNHKTNTGMEFTPVQGIWLGLQLLLLEQMPSISSFSIKKCDSLLAQPDSQTWLHMQQNEM